MRPYSSFPRRVFSTFFLLGLKIILGGAMWERSKRLDFFYAIWLNNLFHERLAQIKFLLVELGTNQSERVTQFVLFRKSLALVAMKFSPNWRFFFFASSWWTFRFSHHNCLVSQKSWKVSTIFEFISPCLNFWATKGARSAMPSAPNPVNWDFKRDATKRACSPKQTNGFRNRQVFWMSVSAKKEEEEGKRKQETLWILLASISCSVLWTSNHVSIQVLALSL